MLKVVFEKFVDIVIIMIAVLPYPDTDVWESVWGKPFTNFKMGKNSTPLQYKTNENHNKSYQLNPHIKEYRSTLET